MHVTAIFFLLIVILTFVFDGPADAGISPATRSDLITATVSIWAVAFTFLRLRYQ